MAKVSLETPGRASADDGLCVHVGRKVIHLSILLVLTEGKPL